jgi:hypothetical protein
MGNRVAWISFQATTFVYELTNKSNVKYDYYVILPADFV